MSKKDGTASVNSSLSTTDDEWTAFVAKPGLRGKSKKAKIISSRGCL